jgi:chromate transporter
MTGPRVGLGTIAGQWARIGIIGFGGPPAHIALLRQLCVERRRWLTDDEFTDGIAACNLLPGPASTQLAIYCAWRLRGAAGAMIGGACFITPGLLMILGLSALLLDGQPNRFVLGAAAGGGAAVAAVAVHAAAGLVPASWRRAGVNPYRWLGYALAGTLAAALLGAWVVLVLLVCGAIEALAGRQTSASGRRRVVAWPWVASLAVPGGGLAALGWVAFKVGALSYGGGFVIIPLMQHDAVDRYHWLSGSQFLYAVALGQITPGPVVHTVAVVGYAAAGLAGALLAAVIAFSPSFLFVVFGARHFEQLRANDRVQAFLNGAGPAAIGAILGSAIVLALAIEQRWQWGVLALALLWLLALRRGVVAALGGAAALGILAVLAGWPVS